MRTLANGGSGGPSGERWGSEGKEGTGSREGARFQQEQLGTIHDHLGSGKERTSGGGKFGGTWRLAHGPLNLLGSQKAASRAHARTKAHELHFVGVREGEEQLDLPPLDAQTCGVHHTTLGTPPTAPLSLSPPPSSTFLSPCRPNPPPPRTSSSSAWAKRAS